MMSWGRWRAAAGVLAVAGSLLVAAELYMRAKSRLAAQLIERALSAHLVDGAAHRPWPWADVAPIARLRVPRLGVQRAVLSGATGATLAFGLGHVDGTAAPGAPGNVALGGHRDHWAAFLAELVPGDRLLLEAHGSRRTCVVTGRSVVAQDAPQALEQTSDDRLTLVTCWPFGGLVGSPWRYVVTCGCA